MTFEAFRQATQRYPAAARIWLDRLASISASEVAIIFEQLPADRISQVAAQFAKSILLFNIHRLLDLRGQLS